MYESGLVEKSGLGLLFVVCSAELVGSSSSGDPFLFIYLFMAPYPLTICMM